jgi:hypothetical protein
VRTAYFDCPTGAAGNMILASLLDAGADVRAIEKRLRKLPVKGWALKLTNVRKQGIAARHLEVVQGPQPERRLADVFKLIDRAKLSNKVTGSAYLIFGALARAEAGVHRTTVDKVHFHEVGAVDAMVDIVGTCLALEDLGIERVYCSPLNVGRGRVKCAHGWLPVPAPATALLLNGARIYQDDLEGELVTPTGAAILSTLSSGFGPMPMMSVAAVGHGAGTRGTKIPNMVRVFIGESEGASTSPEDPVLLETNLDDLNPQVYEHLMDRLFDKGAFDVWLTPVIMKKSRPGTIFSALVPQEIEKAAIDMILSETTTLGVRRRVVERRILPREIVKVRTKYGLISGKMARLGTGGRRFVPEYDECRKAALKLGVPLRIIQEEAVRSFRGADGKR